jgi:hypothetical protein
MKFVSLLTIPFNVFAILITKEKIAKTKVGVTDDGQMMALKPVLKAIIIAYMFTHKRC